MEFGRLEAVVAAGQHVVPALRTSLPLFQQSLGFIHLSIDKSLDLKCDNTHQHYVVVELVKSLHTTINFVICFY